MRYTILIFTASICLWTLSCARRPAVYQAPTPPARAILQEPLVDKDVIWIHFTPDSALQHGERFEPGQILGQADDPGPLLNTVQAVIDTASDLYNNRQFAAAAAILDSALKLHPENPFLMEQLARTWYWAEGQQADSFNMYRRLLDQAESQFIDSLDISAAEADRILVVDMWHQEAYWKIGTLYLDYEEWEKAILNITLFMNTGIQVYPAMHEQALGFLTEAYFALDNYRYGNALGKYTLKLFPRNRYVYQIHHPKRDYSFKPWE